MGINFKYSRLFKKIFLSFTLEGLLRVKGNGARFYYHAKISNRDRDHLYNNILILA